MKRLIAGYVASFARWICRSLRSLVMSQASLASCAARVASLVCRKLRLLVCRKLRLLVCRKLRLQVLLCYCCWYWMVPQPARKR